MLSSRAAAFTGRRLASTLPPVPRKKSHGVRRLLAKAVVATSLFYAGGLTLSAYNDKANELFVEHVPFGEELVERWEDWTSLRRPGRRMIDARRVDEISRDFRAAATPEATPVVVRPLVQLQLPELQMQGSSPVLEALVNNVNDVVVALNARALELPEDTASALSSVYGEIVHSIQALNASLDQEFATEVESRTGKAISSVQEQLEVEYKQRELALAEQYIQNFEVFKSQLQKATAEQLETELKAHEQALLARHRNEVAQLSIRQVEEFNKIIEKKLDQERNGRLAKLSELNSAVESLAPVLDRLELRAVKNECVTQLSTLISDIQGKLSRGGDEPLDLSSDLQRLTLLADILPRPKRCCSEGPALLDVAMAELQAKAQAPVASNEQLYNRWQLLQPELKTTSLLPPNAGFLGHLTAKLFSMLLFTKEGFSTTQDMDAVTARIAENLRLNKLDCALEEAVNMKGWSRKSADAWVDLARRRLEVLTLLDVIEAEVKTL
ncbi:AFR106Cp [Eremothecium gossypii ATCC 10895]|uniref:MICOS complex subunit MIC60 n=1 Tax=Eremothecium gossypii (strain ATCC 10895 / CBS 109.51 / FGSC 9923 / NRRL Y-1056) TaxID=284811 RepID=MIC60_EREGS|nr:AFR106Cp [Eremothecium gossypii ATCC 10895]Q754G4.2 RecName: Full=MICOS complex subunit MIC60; AltName: Full=Mitofilin; Flags: Precursor [Eremothecium gossypii ATCC 10895]AAS53477.2 AFR106Cp [Eremothecium gossypii ATCC 10895]AEY97789.1 FAFR106Cp [Eremothecium gossypii FDAG1]